MFFGPLFLALLFVLAVNHRAFYAWAFSFFQFFYFLNAGVLFAQDVAIQISPKQLPLNHALRVTIEAKNTRITSYSSFPDIQGFKKGNLSSSNATNIVNGRVSSSHSIVQSYYPIKEGRYTLPSFQITVNRQEISSPITDVQVTPPQQQRQQRTPFFSFTDPQRFFGRNEPKEYVDVKADAFLGMYADKEEVYVGEDVTFSLAFYVSAHNEAVLQFYDISNQIAEISQKIKPENVWEERHPIDNIEKKSTTIGGKRYHRYLLYRATFFTLNTNPLKIPSIPLKILKYKVAKNPTFFGRNRQESFKIFHSPKKEIAVRPLPPHPLRDKVAVGVYSIQEKISAEEVQTGNGLSYTFIIEGIGNISALSPPIFSVAEGLEFYPPSVTERVNRSNGRVYGSKTFSYHVIPQEAGTHVLSNHLEWVYFDPNKEAYITLRPEVQFAAFGESLQNQSIRVTGQNSFYHYIASQENALIRLSTSLPYRLGWGISLLVVLLVGMWFAFFRRETI